MSRTEGNKREADYLFDTTYFEYFWSLVEFNRYQERVKKQMEESKTK